MFDLTNAILLTITLCSFINTIILKIHCFTGSCLRSWWHSPKTTSHNCLHWTTGGQQLYCTSDTLFPSFLSLFSLGSFLCFFNKFSVGRYLLHCYGSRLHAGRSHCFRKFVFAREYEHRHANTDQLNYVTAGIPKILTLNDSCNKTEINWVKI